MGGKKPYFPMFVDISKKKILVIGGGKIAERRVETLLKFADNITVISPEMTERLLERVKEKNPLDSRSDRYGRCHMCRKINKMAVSRCGYRVGGNR